MASYQDLETRLAVIEDKLDFTMQAFAVQQRVGSPIVGGQDKLVTKTLLQVYREMKGRGLTPADITLSQADGRADEQAAGDEVV